MWNKTYATVGRDGSSLLTGKLSRALLPCDTDEQGNPHTVTVHKLVSTGQRQEPWDVEL